MKWWEQLLCGLLWIIVALAAGVVAWLLTGCEQRPGPVVEISTLATPTPAVRHIEPRRIPPIAAKVAVVKPTPTPSVSLQQARWDAAKIKPVWQISVDKTVMLYLRTKDRYETVQEMRSNGVPAPVIFALHYRESSNSFTRHLHEGSSLLARTRYVPKGRLPAPAEPPFTWEESAEDAIYVCDRLQGPWTDLTWSLNKIENYNGLGYRKLGVPSPYIWSGTTVYERGKYVSDGHFSASAIDGQLGCAAILKRMKEKGIGIKFDPSRN